MRVKRRGVVFISGLVLSLGVLTSPAAQAQRWQQRQVADPPPYGGVYQDVDEGDYKHRLHFYLGGRGLGLFEVDQITDLGDGYLGHGGGFGLFAGIRLAPLTALEFNWTTTWHKERLNDSLEERAVDKFYLMSFTGDLKLYLPTRHAAEPFFFLGGGYSFLGLDTANGNAFDLDHVFAKGPTWQAGIGFDAWLSRFLTIGGKVYYQGIYLDEPDMNGFIATDDNLATMIGLDASLALHF
jgi:hypothetical protein